MKLETLEKKLDALKNIMPKEKEIFVKIKGWENYLISNFGTVKSLDKPIYKVRPRNMNMNGTYVYKGKTLSPLFAGPSRRWAQVRLTNEKNSWRQLSIVKLMVSSFLNIPIDKLPHSIYCLNCDSKNIHLNNLTFIRKKTGR